MDKLKALSSNDGRASSRLVLLVGFAVLLVLIFLVGWVGTRKLEEVRNAASDRNQDFSARFNSALKIRELAGRAITEARLNQALQGMRVRPPALRADRLGSRADLEAELKRERAIMAERQAPLPEAYRKAWDEAEQSINEYWEYSAIPRAGASVDEESELNRRQLEQRVRVEKATQALVDVMVKERLQNVSDLALMQERAASSIERTGLTALGVGVLVAALAFWLTERHFVQLKRANRRTSEAQDFARSVFESMANDVLVINEVGEVLAVNQAFLTHFRRGEAELAGAGYEAALADLPPAIQFISRTLRDRGDDKSYRSRVEAALPGDESQTRLYDVYVTPLTIGGERRGRVIVLIDVTEAERTREELRRNRTLSTVGQLTAQVAHEIYNPLGAIKLNVELLEHQLNGEQAVQPTVDRLKRGLEHLSTIVLDLRYLTRPRTPERYLTDLNHLVDEAVELAGDRLQGKGIRLERDFAPGPLRGKYDPAQLRKVFLNLLINAVDASSAGAEIQLRTRRAPGELAVSVVDHGVGMSAETKRHLFEAFYSTKQHGTGLGMMITQEIVKKHDGRIEVESQEGRGTEVTVFLPA